MENKMAAGAFGRARNYGWYGIFTVEPTEHRVNISLMYLEP